MLLNRWNLRDLKFGNSSVTYYLVSAVLAMVPRPIIVELRTQTL